MEKNRKQYKLISITQYIIMIDVLVLVKNILGLKLYITDDITRHEHIAKILELTYDNDHSYLENVLILSNSNSFILNQINNYRLSKYYFIYEEPISDVIMSQHVVYIINNSLNICKYFTDKNVHFVSFERTPLINISLDHNIISDELMTSKSKDSAINTINLKHVYISDKIINLNIDITGMNECSSNIQKVVPLLFLGIYTSDDFEFINTYIGEIYLLWYKISPEIFNYKYAKISHPKRIKHCIYLDEDGLYLDSLGLSYQKIDINRCDLQNEWLFCSTDLYDFTQLNKISTIYSLSETVNYNITMLRNYLGLEIYKSIHFTTNVLVIEFDKSIINDLLLSNQAFVYVLLLKFTEDLLNSRYNCFRINYICVDKNLSDRLKLLNINHSYFQLENFVEIFLKGILPEKPAPSETKSILEKSHNEKENISHKLISRKITNNKYAIINNLDIYQIYISDALKHLGRIKSIYNLLDYDNISKPVILFGLFTEADMHILNIHESQIYVMWAGTDCDDTYSNRREILTKFKMNYPDVKHISISKNIQQRLIKYGLNNIYIDLDLTDYRIFVPPTVKPVDNNSIFIYNGYNKGQEDKYGVEVYKEVMAKLPKFNYILSNELGGIPNSEMPMVYSKCFIGLRLTKRDGNANMVREMISMNIPVVHNGDIIRNVYKWNDVNDIISIITQIKPDISQRQKYILITADVNLNVVDYNSIWWSSIINSYLLSGDNIIYLANCRVLNDNCTRNILLDTEASFKLVDISNGDTDTKIGGHRLKIKIEEISKQNYIDKIIIRNNDLLDFIDKFWELLPISVIVFDTNMKSNITKLENKYMNLWIYDTADNIISSTISAKSIVMALPLQHYDFSDKIVEKHRNEIRFVYVGTLCPEEHVVEMCELFTNISSNTKKITLTLCYGKIDGDDIFLERINRFINSRENNNSSTKIEFKYNLSHRDTHYEISRSNYGICLNNKTKYYNINFQEYQLYNVPVLKTNVEILEVCNSEKDGLSILYILNSYDFISNIKKSLVDQIYKKIELVLMITSADDVSNIRKYFSDIDTRILVNFSDDKNLCIKKMADSAKYNNLCFINDIKYTFILNELFANIINNKLLINGNDIIMTNTVVTYHYHGAYYKTCKNTDDIVCFKKKILDRLSVGSSNLLFYSNMIKYMDLSNTYCVISNIKYETPIYNCIDYHISEYITNYPEYYHYKNNDIITKFRVKTPNILGNRLRVCGILSDETYNELSSVFDIYRIPLVFDLEYIKGLNCRLFLLDVCKNLDWYKHLSKDFEFFGLKKLVSGLSNHNVPNLFICNHNPTKLIQNIKLFTNVVVFNEKYRNVLHGTINYYYINRYYNPFYINSLTRSVSSMDVTVIVGGFSKNRCSYLDNIIDSVLQEASTVILCHKKFTTSFPVSYLSNRYYPLLHKEYNDLPTLFNNVNKVISKDEMLVGYTKLSKMGSLKEWRDIMVSQNICKVFDDIFGKIGLDYRFDRFTQSEKILVVAYLSKVQYLSNIMDNFNRQRYTNKELIICTSLSINLPNVIYYDTHSYSECIQKCAMSDSGHSIVSIFTDSDYYGDNYLLDMYLELYMNDNYNCLCKSKYYYFDFNSEHLFIKKCKTSLNISTLFFMKKLLLTQDLVNFVPSTSLDYYNYCSLYDDIDDSDSINNSDNIICTIDKEFINGLPIDIIVGIQ